jgi:hypothetical protein
VKIDAKAKKKKEKKKRERQKIEIRVTIICKEPFSKKLTRPLLGFIFLTYATINLCHLDG